jgi:hypothetical protein
VRFAHIVRNPSNNFAPYRKVKETLQKMGYFCDNSPLSVQCKDHKCHIAFYSGREECFALKLDF